MRDIRLQDIHQFIRMVDLGSLSAVARECQVPVSQISRLLARLEQACGTRLIHRSTHGLTPTAEGAIFAEHGRRILGSVESLEGEFADHSSQPRGWVRVACSTVVAEYLLVPSLARLHAQYPQVRVDLVVDDRIVDMVRDGIDIAIRTGPPSSDTVVARPLGTLARGLYATPSYLATHGTPRLPHDLHQHQLITNSAVAVLNHWPFEVQGQALEVVAEGHWRASTTALCARMALDGLGIARLATMVAQPLVQQGLLALVLANCVAEQPSPIHAITLTRRHRLPKVQACINHWADWFARANRAAPACG